MKVCLDSRLVKKGEYFVPVKGDVLDGHKFIGGALKKGAAGIIEEKELYKLAEDKLKKTNPIVIGIAGSVGKSTFRTYLIQVLSEKYKVLDGFLNTKLGLATIIVNNLTNHEVFIAELGIDRLGEMKQVTDFIRPTFSVITKLEKEHLQFLGNLDNVISENLVCIKNSKNKMGYINIKDKKIVEEHIHDLNVNYFSSNDINLDIPEHENNYLGCIKMIATEKFDFTDADFKKALNFIERPKGRLNLIKGKKGSLIVDDSYNAVCDTSVIEGIKYAKNIAEKYNKNLNIILSPLRETGDTEQVQHKNVAEFLNKINTKNIYLCGEKSNLYSDCLTKPFVIFEDSSKAKISMSSSDLFYVKGSQFYRMENIVKKLMDPNLKAKDILVRQDVRWK
ncbi:hypothetical protein COV24_01615 [candidate division WWE3 bacterium CG10_big_fil_rev_8_21_14_0_10_32_10]|uniref:Mur ligase central domain-containing protein n=1 Tax=candidate division WWE3 bacterium CG10_big_fil_rev_8_21_14_0_10_32_10 TaxID=1975090 RepID=A0A2H0RAU4_UNCKA|nr:MAG: hypothetical protein COV24_01615 [candidate division WWE3 bacterium CG10_big_fil_rev_8_21_14_0_10_32_10]